MSQGISGLNVPEVPIRIKFREVFISFSVFVFKSIFTSASNSLITISILSVPIPVEITVFADRSFTFIIKTPPAAILLKKAAGLDKGSGEPNRDKVGKVSENDLAQIAETKMADLNANTIEKAKEMIRGTARSMGIEVG